MGNGEKNVATNSDRTNDEIYKISYLNREFQEIKLWCNYNKKAKNNKNVDSCEIKAAVAKIEAKCFRESRGDCRRYYTLLGEAHRREHVDGLF